LNPDYRGYLTDSFLALKLLSPAAQFGHDRPVEMAIPFEYLSLILGKLSVRFPALNLKRLLTQVAILRSVGPNYCEAP